MSAPSLTARAIARLTRDLKQAALEARRRRARGADLFVDYGWIRLLYSGDGDAQEIAYHLNAHRWYEKDMHVFRSLLAPGQTAIDVGANLGVLSTMLASLVGPTGRVLSFEPSPVVFSKLQKTIKANDLRQVVPLNLGCGRSRSTEQLHQVSKSSGNSSIVAPGQASVEIRVEALDDIGEAWASPVSLLKIDTEGFEPQVLHGASRLIAEHRPIIYLEMGGDYVDATHESIAFLDSAGYATDHVRAIDWSAIGNGSDYFFLPSR